MSDVAAYQPKAITYPELAEQIAARAAEFKALTIDGVDDKKGLAAVYSARQEVKRVRIAVENRRKELKAESLEYGRQVDSAAKRLTSLLEPIEADLEAKEKAIEDEKNRRKAEAERVRRELLETRMAKLFAVGHQASSILVEHMPDHEFEALLIEKTADYEKRLAEEARIAAEKAEQDRIAAEQRAAEEAERQRKLEAEQAELARQRDEIARQKAEYERQQAIDRERREKIEADERARREAELAAERLKIAEQQAEVDRLARVERERISAQQEEIDRQRREIEAERQRQEQEKREREAAEQAERDRIESERVAKEEADRQESLRPIREQMAIYRERIADAVRMVPVPELGETREQAIASAIAAFMQNLSDIQEAI